MDATSGKVGLFDTVNPNTPCTTEVGMIDHVGYGASVCVEFQPVGALSITTGAARNTGGMMDDDSNSHDFTIVTAPVPHNLASGPSIHCMTTPTRPSTWGQLKSIYR
jgi:hypothetical protein